MAIEIVQRPVPDGVRLTGVVDGRVRGGITALPLRIRLGGEVLPAWGGRELEVDAEERATRLGLLLPDALWRRSPAKLAVCGGTSEKARAVYAGLGYAVFDLPQFALPCRSGRFLGRRFAWGRGVLDAGLAAYFGLLDVLCARRLRGWEREAAVEEDGETLVRVAALAGNRQEVCAEVHDEAWFHWALTRGGCRLVIWRKGNRIAGFALVKLRFHAAFSKGRFKDVRVGHVLEWGAEKREDEAWLPLAGALAVRQECDLLFLVTDGAGAASILHRLGWRARGKGNVVVKASAEITVPWRERASWRLRPGMGDYVLV